MIKSFIEFFQFSVKLIHLNPPFFSYLENLWIIKTPVISQLLHFVKLLNKKFNLLRKAQLNWNFTSEVFL